MEYSLIFDHLKSILEPYSGSLDVVHNEPSNYYLQTRPSNERKGEFFAAVQVKKNYVAFHLMPIYCNPQLLKDISENLKSRMQGKSCFNFIRKEDALFAELASLTEVSFNDFKKAGKIYA